MNIPNATYRIQFNAAFGFRQAEEILDYLLGLGVSHIYASPIFKAQKGSAHGYDVVDPNQLNPELGSPEDFEALVAQLRDKGMYWIQDIIPNHMAFASSNRMLMDVLENGRNSRYFDYFDIDWNHFYEDLKGKLLAPFLGRFYAECLEQGEIYLTYAESGLAVHYYDLSLPVKLGSYARVFGYNLKSLEEKLGRNDPNLAKFLGILHQLQGLSAEEAANHQYNQIVHTKSLLWELYVNHPQIKDFIDSNIALFNGKKEEAESFNKLDELLFEQFFRLSFWKVASEEINYRRFFNINGLICLRSEKEPVFECIHSFTFKKISEGKFTGLRIDHIDGLYDPSTYLNRLREKYPSLYIVVEKILDPSESLPSAWPIQGSSGYDFLNYLNGIFCKIENEKEFTKTYYKFTGLLTSYEELVSEKKRLIIGKHMAGNIDNLAHLLKQAASSSRCGRDVTLYGLKRALVEIMAFFPVYRTYINAVTLSESDRAYIKDALLRARTNSPALEHELNFIEKFLLLELDFPLSAEQKEQLIEFVMRFQQFTAPLMAKGFEDTVLYIYNKLISLNEVGGNPNRFGISCSEFHAFNKNRATHLPHSFNATATHDTKRGEDARARISVLSELPEEWKRNLGVYSRVNRPKKKIIDGRLMPDENDEYRLYQTLIGAWPFYESEHPGFKQRIKDFIIKAVREAKVHTAWIKPDTQYEDACLAFVEKMLDFSKPGRFLREFTPFQKKIAFFGIFNSLSQVMIKIAAPGVPDFYQGSELWDLSLVDPDNRRLVDFKKRKDFLDYIIAKSHTDILGLINELLAAPQDGRIKLFLIHQALKARNQNCELFKSGDYIPLDTEGRFAQNVIAFARRKQDAWAITIAPRFLVSLIKEGELPFGREKWDDTRIIFPEEIPLGSCKDAISAETVNIQNNTLVGDILNRFPVSLLLGGSTQ